MLWLVLILKSGSYTVHSIHKEKTVAEQWAKVKEYDGDDASIAEMSDILVQTLRELLDDTQ